VIKKGDIRIIAPRLASQSVNCIVTSPPYWGLRDYGHADQIGLEPTPEAYVQTMVGVFGELHRVLRDDGTLWLNLGDTFVAKNLVGIPWRVALALQADGWYLRSDIIWSKPNCMPESVTDRPTKAHEYLFLLSKTESYYYDQDAIREPNSMNRPRKNRNNSTTFKRNGSKREQTIPGQGYGTHRPDRSDTDYNPLGRNKRSVWEVSLRAYGGAHFAVFPPDLIEPCILAGCPPGGIVLDPFFGSGTVGQVAIKTGRNWLGIEINSDYIKLAEERINGTQLPLIVPGSEANKLC